MHHLMISQNVMKKRSGIRFTTMDGILNVINMVTTYFTNITKQYIKIFFRVVGFPINNTFVVLFYSCTMLCDMYVSSFLIKYIFKIK